MTILNYMNSWKPASQLIWNYSFLQISTVNSSSYHCVGEDWNGENMVDLCSWFFFLSNSKFRNSLLDKNRYPVLFWEMPWLFIASTTGINWDIKLDLENDTKIYLVIFCCQVKIQIHHVFWNINDFLCEKLGKSLTRSWSIEKSTLQNLHKIYLCVNLLFKWYNQ
jgi:hypothetical protein